MLGPKPNLHKRLKTDFLVIKKIEQLDRTNFGRDRKLINAKFWLLTCQVPNEHAQHKMVWGK